jgi:hypothetical protein
VSTLPAAGGGTVIVHPAALTIGRGTLRKMRQNLDGR